LKKATPTSELAGLDLTQHRVLIGIEQRTRSSGRCRRYSRIACGRTLAATSGVVPSETAWRRPRALRPTRRHRFVERVQMATRGFQQVRAVAGELNLSRRAIE